MKVMYQSSSYIPSQAANSIHVMSMAESFSENGCEVLLTGIEGDLKIDQSIYSYYGVSDSFKIKLFKGRGEVNRILYSFYCLFLSFLFRPDLIVSRNFFGAFLLSLFGFKVLFDVHSPFWSSSKIKVFLWFIIKNNKKLYVTTNSNYLKKKIDSNNYLSPFNEVHVLFNGAKAIKVKKGYFDKTSALDVGYVGGLYKGRGVEFIMELARKTPSIKYHIAGGTDVEICKLKDNFPDVRNVIFYGHLAPALTPNFRYSCDVLLAPYSEEGVFSFGDSSVDQSKYQNPIKLIEYLSAGKAIVASDIQSVRDILPQNSAVLIDPNKIDLWIDLLIQLSKDRSKVNVFSRKAKNLFSSDFTWLSRVKKMMEIIK